jgi:hypothetical protein
MRATSSSSVAQRLSRLAVLYERGQASELMAHEAQQAQDQLDELSAELAEIEQRYGMTSEEFFRRFQAGQTDDRMDFLEWASLAQMAENLRARAQARTHEAMLNVDRAVSQGFPIPG